jgi:hypothetical protein
MGWQWRVESAEKSMLARVTTWAREPGHEEAPFEPSQFWSDGGPIIERERIGISYDPGVQLTIGQGWWAIIDDYEKPIRGYGNVHETIASERGATPLIAAMRAFVASRQCTSNPKP